MSLTDPLRLLLNLAERDDVPLAVFLVTAALVFVQVASSVLALVTSALLVRIEKRYGR